MVRTSKSERVPQTMRPVFDGIVGLTDEFCNAHLSEEYAQMARQAALARKRPSPLTRGRRNAWACGSIHAIGSVNFLFDRGEEPSMSIADLSQGFGVGQSTSSAKAKEVMNRLSIKWIDLDWWLPSQLGRHPFAWLVEIDGVILDARYLRRGIQEALAEDGLIPFLPAERGSN